MAFKFSTGARKAILDSGSVRATFDLGKIEIYSGTAPADADAEVGVGPVLLTTITNDATATGLTFEAVATGAVLVKTLTEVWKGVNAATGTATWWRWVMPADTGALSTTEVRIQGTCGLAGADMNLSSVVLTAAADQILDYFALAFPTAT